MVAMSRIFISHNSQDAKEAVALKQWLAESGWDDVFLDIDARDGLSPGERWKDALRTAADRCEAILCLVSPTWLASAECKLEFRYAETLRKAILLTLIKPCEPGSLPPDWQWCPLFGDGAQTAIRFKFREQETECSFLTDGLDRLKNGLEKAGINAESFPWPPATEPDRAPYRGLKPLEAVDAAVFFGRDADILRGMETLRDMRQTGTGRLLVILGASGSGKSSFMRAGLLPRLARDDRRFFCLPVIRPRNKVLLGDDGLAPALAAASSALGTNRTRGKVEDWLRGGPEMAESLLERLVLELSEARSSAAEPAPPSLIIPIDQGEELFNPEGANEASPFMALLGRLLAGQSDAPAVLGRIHGQVMAVLTIRSDRYERLQSAPELTPVTPRLLDLRPFPVGQFERVINGPAERSSKGNKTRPLKIEPALSDRLLKDFAQGADTLPLLAFALEKLYHKYGSDGDLTLEEYESIRGSHETVQAAIFQEAVDNALAEPFRPPVISDDREEQINALRRAFVPHLARINPETNVPMRQVAQFNSLPAEVHPYIERLVEARLLVRDKDDIEVAHESLLRQWSTLSGWLTEEKDNLRTLEKIRSAAADWHAASAEKKEKLRDELLSHRGELLIEAETLLVKPGYAEAASHDDRAYLIACRKAQDDRVLKAKEEQDRRIRDAERIAEEQTKAAMAQRKIARRTKIGLALVTLFAVFAGWQYKEARNHQQATEIARLDAEYKSRIATSQRLAAQADSALSRFPQRALLLAVEAVNTSLRNKEPIVADAERALRRALAEVGGRGLGGTGAPVLSFAQSADGRWLAAGGQNTVHLWDFTSPEQRPKEIKNIDGEVGQLIFAGSGQWIVATTRKGTPHAWSLAGPEPIATPLAAPKGIGRVVYARLSIDGRRLLALTEDGGLVLWDLTTSTPTATPHVFRSEKALAPLELMSTDIRASVDGRWLALKTVGHPVQLWDLHAENPASHPMVLAGSDGLIPLLQISPDQRWLLEAGEDHAVRLWDLAAPDPSKGPRVLQGHSAYPSGAKFSADGRWLVTGSFDKTARVWDLSATDPSAASIVLPSNGAPVDAVSTSMDGRWVVASSLVNRLDPGGKFDTTALLWDMHRPEPAANPFRLSGHEVGVAAAEVTEDGRWAITASEGGQVRLWDLTAENPSASPLVLHGHEGGIFELSISKDGHWLISHAVDMSIRVWDLRRPQVATTPLAVVGSGAGELYPSPDSRWLGVSNFDGAAHLLDLASSNPAASDLVMPEMKRFSTLVADTFLYSADGRWMVASDAYSESRLFDLTAAPVSETARTLEDGGGVRAKAISADSRWLVSFKNNEARLWDLSKGNSEVLRLLGHSEAISHATISMNSHWLATGSDDGMVRLWNLQAADPSQTGRVLAGHAKRVTACEFSPDSRSLLTTSDEGTVQLWDLATEEEPRATMLRGYTGAVSGAFSPDSRWLVTSDGYHPARLWDLKAPKPEATSREFPGPNTKSDGASFSPDGRWVVTLDGNKMPRLWDLHAANLLAKPSVLSGHEHGVGILLISKDSRWLATAGAVASFLDDKVVRLWDLTLEDPSKAPLTLRGHERNVSALAMSADSGWLISGSDDATLRLWNLRAANPADAPIVLSGHRRAIRQIVVNADSRLAASTSEDSDVRLWHLRSSDLLTLASHATGRNLAFDEWELFFPGQPYRKTWADLPEPVSVAQSKTNSVKPSVEETEKPESATGSALQAPEHPAATPALAPENL